MRTQLSLTVIGFYLILAAASADAHHSFNSEYDAKRPVTLRGTVFKIEWINPHVWIYVESKRPDGVVEQWGIETANPSNLVSRGITRDFLKLGTDVTINGYQSKSGALRAHGRDIAVANGQPIFIGTMGIGAPYDDGGAAADVQRGVRTQVSGAWWMNAALMQRLGITDDQKAKIERTFENHREKILSTTDQLEKEEALLARLLDADPVDRNAVYTQIDRVIQARSEMERAGAVMTLEMREYLTRTQWSQLPRTNLTISTTGLAERTPVPVPAPGPGLRGR